MIDLILYSINDCDNVINKNLANGVTIPINLKQGFDIINPEIVLNGDYRGFNYAHIPNLNRYYFVNNTEQLNMHLVKLNMTCDVLETYKADILNGEFIYNRDIKDGDFISFSGSTDVMDLKQYFSDVELTQGNSIIISTIEV